MMRKTKTVASIVAIVMIFSVVFMAVQSLATDSKYLNITGMREGDETYKITSLDPQKTIWKIVSYDSMLDGAVASYQEAIYCVNPEVGFGSATTAGNDRKEYNASFDMKNLKDVEQKYKDMFPDQVKYNSILWILDNCYLPKQTPEADKTMVKNTLFKAAGIDREVLTDNDIEVVQQLALWYFASDNPAYHFEPENFPSIALNDTAIEELGGPLSSVGVQRKNDMVKLYTYLITSAKSNSAAYGTGDTRELDAPSISFTKPTSNNTITTVENIDGTEYFVSGPYNIQETNHTVLPYTFEASVLDQSENDIEAYVVLDENKNMTTNTDIDEALLGEDFYIAVPTTNKNVEKIKMSITANYISTKATLWTHSDNYLTEQPVVIVEKDPHEIEETVEVEVKRPEFDLSLRKFITKVNEEDTILRVPQVTDLDKLADGSSKTATYTHPKDAITVKTGDIVTYTIRVYNEGEMDGYAAEITDNIPEGLEYLPENTTNQEYMWELSEDGTKITTRYLSKEQDEDNLLQAFDSETMNELDYKDVKVVFKVIEPNNSTNVLLNIAEISEDTDKNGEPVDDRDSTPNNDDITEDDIDIERLVLVELEFDLSLRKFITKVNEEDTILRVPQVTDLDKLADGSSKTATYTHLKDPIVVKTGDIVTYTIRVYNEGKMDGYAAEITDNIPEGLKFLTDNETNIEYMWKLSADGTKITTKYLSKEQNEDNLLKAFDPETMDELSFKDVKVVFEVTEPNNSTRVLTNVAEISEDTNENGEPVDDRDSFPDNNIPNEDDIDVEHLVLVDAEFDLSLRKFIAGINEEKVTTREPDVDVSGLKDGSSKTATYTHSKDALTVKTGDIVTYTIRVYNEGEMDGYAAEITDNIPEGLKFLTDNETNIEYMWKLSADGTKITTSYLAIEQDEENLLKAFNPETMDDLDYKDVKVAFEVIEPNDSERVLVNIAEISEETDENGEPVDDRDSIPNNNEDGEDDIDKEYVKLAYFDLSLRKFITRVNNKQVTNRIPQVDISKLVDGTAKTATYTHSKETLNVQTGDMVVYTIRVYNEGRMDGTALEITDYVPEGLKFVPVENSSINKQYGWVLSKDGKTVKTEYLANSVIKGFDKNSENPTLDYKDVVIEFEVVEPATSSRVLRNIAEISKDSGEDRDSTPDNVDINKYTPPADNSNYQEDDDDYENIKLQYFDLSLRKFITKVNSEEVTTRYPVVTLDENGELVYTHTKSPVLVANNNIVVYTIRVYNEGSTAGYAKEVTDNVPEGLSYMPEHELNKKYGWVISEDGKTVSTDYLSKEKSEERNEDSLLKPFNKNADISDEEGKLNPDYRDLQIAFKVTEKNLPSSRIIINTAEITDDSDENGNDIKDIDSTPGNDVPGEDDIDNEYLKVKFFDLSLLKWVSKAYVTEDGKTTVTDTGHTGLENPEPVVKVDLDRKNLSKVTVKFGYTIKVTNEGEIAGYAKEISDYIPEGLKFVKEDNPDWEEKDGKILTRKLEDKLLEPGESATVEVILTWINSGENIGLKVNTAEISEDYNEDGAKDIDSTPDNHKEGEDDIDDAPVILTIKTGSAPTYFVLGVTVLAMLASGIILIKKFVLD